MGTDDGRRSGVIKAVREDEAWVRITEENVVHHIQNRNEEALRFIIQHYGGLLAAVILRTLNHDKQGYEECLDDVLLAVWQHIDAFDPNKNSFKQWIAAIAKYKAIDYLRKQITFQERHHVVAEVDQSPEISTGIKHEQCLMGNQKT